MIVTMTIYKLIFIAVSFTLGGIRIGLWLNNNKKG